jgi:hypothetical protein
MQYIQMIRQPLNFNFRNLRSRFGRNVVIPCQSPLPLRHYQSLLRVADAFLDPRVGILSLAIMREVRQEGIILGIQAGGINNKYPFSCGIILEIVRIALPKLSDNSYKNSSVDGRVNRLGPLLV